MSPNCHDFSEEDTISCSTPNGNGCDPGGGGVSLPYSFYKTDGYAFADQMPLVSTGSTVEVPCRTADRLSMDKGYSGDGAYLDGLFEEVWMRELMNNGPAYIEVYVYGSFDAYNGGIYQLLPTDGPANYRGPHAVRLIGWGTDAATGLKYWKVGNRYGMF